MFFLVIYHDLPHFLDMPFFPPCAMSRQDLKLTANRHVVGVLRGAVHKYGLGNGDRYVL